MMHAGDPNLFTPLTQTEDMPEILPRRPGWWGHDGKSESRRGGTRGKGRDFAGVHKGFPAGVAVIGGCRIAIGTLCQVPQFLERVFTERRRIALLFPLRLEVSRLSLCHATSSTNSLGQVCRQAKLRQAHTGNGGSISLRAAAYWR